ncbi:uncharacterized protein LOC136071452 [Quercus suber]|uniref:uncharacterized protein LOC136071452 n=1 Tax=Quercus suber TaxID=58331 RepID=UPI0032DEA2C4
MRPIMLPNGIEQIRVQDTLAEAKIFFEERKSVSDEIQASKKLLAVNTDIPPSVVKGDRSKSVLFDGCRLAKSLQCLEIDKKWELCPLFIPPIITLGLLVVFKTLIYHCNVDSAGNLILDILNDSWSPALIITKVLLGIRSKFVFVCWEGDLRVLDHAGMHPLHMSPTAVANANFIECMNILFAAHNPLIPGIAQLYSTDREKHDELAAEWTRRFAK